MDLCKPADTELVICNVREFLKYCLNILIIVLENFSSDISEL